MTARVVGIAAVFFPSLLAAQQPPGGTPADSGRPPVLAPVTVSVSRDQRPLGSIAAAVAVVDSPAIARARPTWGLDEALTAVPGVYAANRYNFSLDQRISIRGFGARSSFGIRGIKVLIDGIPQSLPDGTGQLTNLELGNTARMEVLRGASSALFGNASGGVISFTTDERPPAVLVQEFRVTAGTFDRHNPPLFGSSDAQTWSKWMSSSLMRVGKGYAGVVLSRLDYSGQRQHSDADLRNANARLALPLSNTLTLNVTADIGNDPRADNPGALTAAELQANPDSAAAINLARQAGKDVSQYQAGATLTRRFSSGGEAALTVFGFSRDLDNPQTFAYIQLDRQAYGLRATAGLPAKLLGLRQRVTAGLDLQRQRDDRVNFGNNAGRPDTVRQLDQLEHVTEVGPFVQSAVAISDATTVTAGVRYDRVEFTADDRLVSATNPDDSGSRLMQAVDGTLGITHRARGTTLYANVGTSFETPTTTELTNRPDTAGGFNATLEPQRAVNIEVGARGALLSRVGWSLALFRSNVRDALIPYAIAGSPGRVFYQNSGRSRNQGVELGADVSIAAPWRAVIAWTWSDFRYTDYTTAGHVLDGRKIPGIPASWLKALLQFNTQGRGGWWEWQLTHSSSVLVNDTLSTRAGSWWLSDVRAGWNSAVAGMRLSPFVSIANVFDRKYVSSVVINAAGGRYYEPAPGRNGYAGLSLGFGH